MDDSKTVKILLKGLTCAHCAGRIEEAVQKQENVAEANLNFMNKIITVKIKDNTTRKDMLAQVRGIVDSIESGITVTFADKKKTRRSSDAEAVDGSEHHHDGEHCHDGEHRHDEGHCHDEHCGCEHRHDEHHHDEHHHDEHHHDEHHHDEHHHDEHHHDVENHNSADIEQSDEYESVDLNDDEHTSISRKIMRFGCGAVLYIAALICPQPVNIALFVAAYVVFGYDVVIRAFKNIARGQVFDENFLMTVATMGAFVLSVFANENEYSEAVAVMFFYQIGELLQDKAVDKSRRSIKDLMNLQAEKANVIIDGEVSELDPEEIEVGDICIIKAGEKIPVDGIVTEGSTELDMSALTGEAREVHAAVGDRVISGSINKGAVIQIRAEREYSNSTVGRIMDMVENAAANKSTAESFITKFAKIYTPVVVGIAVVLALIPPVFDGLVLGTGFDFANWVKRALVFLVSSCPCALVVSVPLTFFSGLGVSSKNGVLVKGSNFLQTLADTNTVVFDKTGTITKGKFAVTETHLTPELAKYTASAELYSNHPIAKAITKEFAPLGFVHPDSVEEIKGLGITAKINGNTVAVGGARLMDKLKIDFDRDMDVSVFVAFNGKFEGGIKVEDAVKPDSITAVSMLKKLGINSIVMFTGDRDKDAARVAKQVGIKQYYSELMPDDKVEKLEEIYAQNADAKVVFVGDGINDAPVLARADVGAAMGEIGSDAAIEAADIVIIHDEISKLATAIKIALKTMRTVRQNVVFVLAVKIVVLVLAVFGFANMWLAVFADVGVALIAIANSIRILNFK